jgi:FtsH-binding integral membrane protein
MQWKEWRGVCSFSFIIILLIFMNKDKKKKARFCRTTTVVTTVVVSTSNGICTLVAAIFAWLLHDIKDAGDPNFVTKAIAFTLTVVILNAVFALSTWFVIDYDACCQRRCPAAAASEVVDDVDSRSDSESSAA